MCGLTPCVQTWVWCPLAIWMDRPRGREDIQPKQQSYRGGGAPLGNLAHRPVVGLQTDDARFGSQLLHLTHTYTFRILLVDVNPRIPLG